MASKPLTLTPKRKRVNGCSADPPALAPPDRERAEGIAAVAKALGDPIRVQLVEVLREHAGKVCVCDLEPLFDVSQPTISHHLRKLREAGILDAERQGLWTYYYVKPEALAAFAGWLDD